MVRPPSTSGDTRRPSATRVIVSAIKRLVMIVKKRARTHSVDAMSCWLP
jgi:hypothetical protein